MIYDYIIVGGGVAGIYFAYKMINKNPKLKILLLESDSRFGGRIQTKTIQINNTNNIITYEAGAGRFFKSHNLLNELIKELDLTNKIKTIPNSDIKFISKNKESTLNIEKYVNLLKQKIKEDIDQTQDEKKVYEKLLSKNLYEIMIDYLGEDEANLFRTMYIYWDDLMDCNAVDGMRFLEDMDVKEFYVLAGGLSQIIDKMINLIKDKVDLILNNKVLFINFPISTTNNIITKVGIDIGKIYKTKNVILACPKNSIKKIHFNKISPEYQFKLYNLLDMVDAIPLVRIFCTFPINKNGKSWFDQMSKFTTLEPIKFVIPMDPKNGFIQISYTNSINAKIMMAIHERGELKQYLENYFREIFPKKNIPNIDELIIEYHENGVHHWSKNILGKNHYNEMLKPFNDYNLYIIGESYSLTQAWVEGALETADSIIKML